MLYSLVTGIIALKKPPRINNEESETVIIRDHFRNCNIFPVFIIPGILRRSKTISERRKNRKPYSMNASQNPPIILKISVITEECFDSRTFAAIKKAASKKKLTAYITLWFLRKGIAFNPL
jgi:hypothetical protein